MPPFRALANVGSGAAELVMLPLSYARRDGRVVLGLRHGARGFARSLAVETLHMGARVAHAAQTVLETAQGMLGGEDGGGAEGAPPRPRPPRRSRYANQPGNFGEGVRQGYDAMTRQVSGAAQTVVAIPLQVYEREGTGGAMRRVVRAVPITVVQPLLGATQAVSRTLLGARNSLDPELKADADRKYKRLPPGSKR